MFPVAHGLKRNLKNRLDQNGFWDLTQKGLNCRVCLFIYRTIAITFPDLVVILANYPKKYLPKFSYPPLQKNPEIVNLKQSFAPPRLRPPPPPPQPGKDRSFLLPSDIRCFVPLA